MDRAELHTEAIAFTRYLIDAEPSEELIERYCSANAVLFEAAPSAVDLAVLEFARRHRWSIPMLDASSAITREGSLFRKKLLVMMAILETTTRFAGRTEQQSLGLPRLAMRLGSAGVVAAFNLVTGFALYVAITRRRVS